MKGFASDNYAGAHPDVVAAVAAANVDHAPAYGADPWTGRAEELFREHFGSGARAYLVFNGSAANVCALRALCRPWEAVICPATAHINVDECGAAEAIAGVKLIDVPTRDGKLTPADVLAQVQRVGDEHAAQPRVVSITQSTEYGTCYSLAETRALADVAHDHDLFLHVDGARLCNAAAALGVSLRELTTDAGVDALSFGATKNGALFGEAVVFLAPQLAANFQYLRKQTLQLASKGRFLAAQFVALLEGDLWLRNAAHANAMTQRLAGALAALPNVQITQAVEANEIFAVLPPAVAERLRADFPFYTWDEATGEVRLVCSWDTDPGEVDAFAAAASALTRAAPAARANA